ncbi:universal stress protein [Streptomyces sp. NPDC051561]|uniref:universal stress protein n=1 Tax=Streptomyces sp. NPDC051561 TaxID=3365658 RepID=UPI0037B8EA8D
MSRTGSRLARPARRKLGAHVRHFCRSPPGKGPWPSEGPSAHGVYLLAPPCRGSVPAGWVGPARNRCPLKASSAMSTVHATSASERKPVVVGVSRSEASKAGVAWAAEEAVLRALPLRLVHALEWPPGAEPRPHGEHPQYTWSGHFRAAGEMLLREAADLVHKNHPQLEIVARTADGPRARVLVQQGPEASLLVVGVKPLNMVEQMFSVSPLGVTLTAHAGCPVAVVRRPRPTAAGSHLVVVGVDGSANAQEAMMFAFEEAALAGARLKVVMVRHHHSGRLAGVEDDEVENRTRAELVEATAGCAEKYPQVEIEYQVEYGHPARALARAAAHARCLVVGSRGLGGFRGMVVGSVSHVLLHQAVCPLFVVPPLGGPVAYWPAASAARHVPQGEQTEVPTP